MKIVEYHTYFQLPVHILDYPKLCYSLCWVDWESFDYKCKAKILYGRPYIAHIKLEERKAYYYIHFLVISCFVLHYVYYIIFTK